MNGIGHLRKKVGELGAWLAVWETRAPGQPSAHARRCANNAMDAIDDALRELHEIRAALITETRSADDATAARVDVMLAGGQARRRGGG